MEKQTSKYTEKMVADMVAAQPLNIDKAKELAARWNVDGVTYKGVIAKAGRDGLEYTKKAPVAKDGSPIASKDAIVAEISAVVGHNLDGLEKASKVALQRLRAFVLAHADEEAA